MTGHGAKFGRKHEEAIAALLSQRNVDEAARVVGVDPKTLLRWLKMPEFQAAYRRLAAKHSHNRLRDSSRVAPRRRLRC
jgi:transposase-like protein